MTLIRNKKEFNLFEKTDKLAVKELKEFREKFPWFSSKAGLKLKMSKRFKKPSKIQHNIAQGIVDKPESIGFHNDFQVMTDDGPLELLYCDRYVLDTNGRVADAMPARISIKDDITIPFSKVDYAYFLYQHPACENGPNHDPSNNMSGVFYFEEPEKEAISNLEMERLEAKVKALILNQPMEGGLTREELETVTLAYQLKLTQNGLPKSAEVLRQGLSTIVKLKVRALKPERAYRQFLKLVDRKEDAEMLSLINIAQEVGVIGTKGLRPGKNKGTGGNMYWFLKDVNGDQIKEFAYYQKTGASGTDPEQVLLEYLQKNTEIVYDIRVAVNREKVGV